MAGSLSLATNPSSRARLGGRQAGRALREHAALAENGGRRPEIARVEKIGEQRLERAEDLAAGGLVGLGLEEVEQDVERGHAHVPAVLVLDRRGDLVDLLLLEEVERGVELLQVDDALRPRRRLLGGRRPAIARGGLRLLAARGVAAGLLGQAGPGVAEELDEIVLDELELLLPEQGQQVVARVRRAGTARG